MAFKINLSEKSGKTYKLEVEAPLLEGKLLHDKINGKDISDDLEGYELTFSPVLVSRLPVGSSAKITSGLFASALAIATLCICPPEI